MLAYAGCCLPDIGVAPGNQSTHRNFSLAGMEEGHLAPFKTMSQSLVALQYANLYTNIVPQLQAFNGGAWRSLEEQIRNWGAVGPGPVKVVVGVVFNTAAGPPPPAAAANQPGALPMYLPSHYFMALYFPGQPQGSRHRFFLFPNNGAPCGGGNFLNCQIANLAAFNAALPANYTINLNFPPP
jgi:DNA/RNA endonuclease G (NUC1)